MGGIRVKDGWWIATGFLLLGIFVAQIVYLSPKKIIVVAPPPIVQTEDVAAIELVTAPLRVPLTPDEYLCQVYHRTPIKKDGAGDFTWKDQMAAQRLGMDICTYSIGGMAPELRVRLVAFGKEADEQGLEWSMSSGFRDDYRQSIASGVKARTGNSLHGNSRATKGYGYGRAIDITSAKAVGPVLALFDKIGRDLGLSRPYKGFDPSHIQLASIPAQVGTKSVAHRVAKAKTKAHYAKRVKHHTRVVERSHDHDYHRNKKRGWS